MILIREIHTLRQLQTCGYAIFVLNLVANYCVKIVFDNVIAVSTTEKSNGGA